MGAGIITSSCFAAAGVEHRDVVLLSVVSDRGRRCCGLFFRIADSYARRGLADMMNPSALSNSKFGDGSCSPGSQAVSAHRCLLGKSDGNRFSFHRVVSLTGKQESHALWRWIGIHPRSVIVVAGEDFGLADAYLKMLSGKAGFLHAGDIKEHVLQSLREKSHYLRHTTKSIVVHRTGRELAAELSQIYGHDFDQPTYIPACSDRQLRLGRSVEVERLAVRTSTVRKILSKERTAKRSRHLVFAELAERTEIVVTPS